ncbi:MAG: thiamine phosphate synthase [Ignavibacteria bacterium]|nr:thiamine phosphate synthase [Ignavibacteria bacterium]
MKKIGKLCVITDTAIQRKYTHYEIARMAIKGGADMIQFRDKTLPTALLIKEASKIAALCKRHDVLFVNNDRVDVAMIIGNAGGVHLGKEDISIKDARKLLGKRKVIGGTAHSLKEAIQREKEGADYIGYGHIFATGSKFKPDKPKGTAELKRILKIVKIPVLAIGGIGLNNIEEVIQTGVHGVAVIGSVLKSKNPAIAVKELRKKIYEK